MSDWIANIQENDINNSLSDFPVKYSVIVVGNRTLNFQFQSDNQSKLVANFGQLQCQQQQQKYATFPRKVVVITVLL